MNNGYVVYLHIFPNNKKYVGITKRTPKDRWQNGYGYKKQKVFSAIKKYGWDNIEHIVVLQSLDYEQACKIEQILIEYYKSNNPNFGYNKSSGGEKSAVGYKHTEEEKEKIKNNNARYWNGKKRGSDFMRKIAQGNKNRKGKKHTNISKQLNKEKHSIKVLQFDTKDNYIKTWDCIKDAELFYKLSPGSISKVCKGNRKTTGGYKWRYGG